MTDNEIIKALENCNLPYSDYKCVSCPLYDTESNCKTALIVIALDLINRQKAEIEQWKEEANKYQSLFASACTEAKSEAVREFAERLSGDLYKFPSGYKAQLRNMIKNLVAEMTEQ